MQSKVIIGGILRFSSDIVTIESFVRQNGTISVVSVLALYLPRVKLNNIFVADLFITPASAANNLRMQAASQVLNIRWSATYIAEAAGYDNAESSITDLQAMLDEAVDTGRFMSTFNLQTKNRFNILGSSITFGTPRQAIIRSASPTYSPTPDVQLGTVLQSYAVALIAVACILIVMCIACGFGYVYYQSRHQSAMAEGALDASAFRHDNIYHADDTAIHMSPSMLPMKNFTRSPAPHSDNLMKNDISVIDEIDIALSHDVSIRSPNFTNTMNTFDHTPQMTKAQDRLNRKKRLEEVKAKNARSMSSPIDAMMNDNDSPDIKSIMNTLKNDEMTKKKELAYNIGLSRAGSPSVDTKIQLSSPTAPGPGSRFSSPSQLMGQVRSPTLSMVPPDSAIMSRSPSINESFGSPRPRPTSPIGQAPSPKNLDSTFTSVKLMASPSKVVSPSKADRLKSPEEKFTQPRSIPSTPAAPKLYLMGDDSDDSNTPSDTPLAMEIKKKKVAVTTAGFLKNLLSAKQID